MTCESLNCFCVKKNATVGFTGPAAKVMKFKIAHVHEIATLHAQYHALLILACRLIDQLPYKYGAIVVVVKCCQVLSEVLQPVKVCKVA